MSKTLVRYSGPGGELFPDFHWMPEPGEERELPVAKEEINHPHLEIVRSRKERDDEKDEHKPSKESR